MNNDQSAKATELTGYKRQRRPAHDSGSFYDDLPSFSDFRRVNDWTEFAEAPPDWYVVITDVKGSTEAIETGHYKDVNTIGAASISCVQVALKQDFPYVFGGDGASMLIPPDSIQKVIDELLRLARLSALKFGLDLRVGRIQVSEVCNGEVSIEVAKHELYAGRCMAVVRGGGLTRAEQLIKGDEERHCVRDENSGNTVLAGLSCRWRPIPSKQGRILSLLVSARGDDPTRVYEGFLQALDNIFENGIEEANPVNLDQLSYKSIGECIADERRYHTRPQTPSFLARMFEIVMAVLVFKYKLHPLIMNPDRYRKSMRLHSDFWKFDDTLRMVVDCTRYQALAIRDYLIRAERSGELYYGIHESDTALMTCFVESVNDGEHVHFIDGGDGGYAMAAKKLKSQMATGPD